MSLRIRPIDLDDEAALSALDQAYADQHRLAGMVRPAALSYFARSGHAFVAEELGDDGRFAPVGFLLAHALWDGWAPSVALVRLVAQTAAARHALVEACVKSAYDAAVKHLSVDVPEGDQALLEALAEHEFTTSASIRKERRLGSASDS